MKRSYQHEYYHRDGKTDISVMRRNARRALRDDWLPGQSLIHHHAKEDACSGYTHEEFLFPSSSNVDASPKLSSGTEPPFGGVTSTVHQQSSAKDPGDISDGFGEK